MAKEVDTATAEILNGVAAKQKEHLARLDALLDALTRSQGDI
jgi:mannitol/fructose-specific phosphotransferase system IIA component